MATRQQLGVLAVLAQQLHRVVRRLRPFVIERRRDHGASPPSVRGAEPNPPPAPPTSGAGGAPAPWMARHTRSGVHGRSMSVMPNGARASITAFTTAGGDAMVPVSPTPLTPSSFEVEGVSDRPMSTYGTSE